MWLDEIRTKFRFSAEKQVASAGFASLFARVDQDGSGEIDETEFAEAVRLILAITEATMSNTELQAVFQAVDADGSGEIDADEFTAWLRGEVATTRPPQAPMTAMIPDPLDPTPMADDTAAGAVSAGEAAAQASATEGQLRGLINPAALRDADDLRRRFVAEVHIQPRLKCR